MDHQLLQVTFRAAIAFKITDVKARMSLAGLLFKISGFIDSIQSLEE